MDYYGCRPRSRLLLGTSRYPTPAVLAEAVRALPNDAGCLSVKEAVTTAQMGREIFATPWVALEGVGEPDALAPDGPRVKEWTSATRRRP